MGSSIKIEGDVSGLLGRMQEFVGLDKKRLNNTLSEVVRTSTVERFRHQRGPDGKRWRPSIRVATEGGVTLTKTTGLRNSIKSMADESGFAVGTNKIYAATHQLGEPGRTIRAKTAKGLRFKIGGRWIVRKQVRIKIPPRPFFGLDEADMQEIKHTVEDALGG